jgi:hypothetical protein
MSTVIPFPAKSLLLAALLAGSNALFAADQTPVLLYSRYFNAKGETRYLPDGTYKDVLTRLRATSSSALTSCLCVLTTCAMSILCSSPTRAIRPLAQSAASALLAG